MKMTDGDLQKLLQIGLQSLTIQTTLLENQIAESSSEMRTLERDEELEKLERQLLAIQQDYRHYSDFVDTEAAEQFKGYYYEEN